MQEKGTKDSARSAVREYDFRNPERLTIDRKAEIGDTQETVADALAHLMSRALSSPTVVTFGGVAEGTGVLVGSPATMPVYRITGADGDLLHICVESSLAQAFIDRLLGGGGESRDVEREPTVIEQGLLASVTGTVGALFIPAGEGVVSEYVPPKERSSDAFPAGIVSMFQMTLESGASGAIGILQPYGAVMDLAAPVAPANDTIITPETISEMELEVQAVLPPAQIPIRDIYDLRVGDVLHLGCKATDAFELRIENQTAFYGYAGTDDGNVALQIDRPARRRPGGEKR